jgi:hypothetical protein
MQRSQIVLLPCFPRPDKQFRHYVVEAGDNPRTACQQIGDEVFVIPRQYGEIIADFLGCQNDVARMRLAIDRIFDASEVREFCCQRGDNFGCQIAAILAGKL